MLLHGGVDLTVNEFDNAGVVTHGVENNLILEYLS